MTNQELFLLQLKAQRDTIQNLWWNYQDTDGEINYWKYELQMRADAVRIAFESFRSKYTLARSMTDLISSYLAQPGAGLFAFTYKATPISADYYAFETSGASPTLKFTRNQALFDPLTNFSQAINANKLKGASPIPNPAPQYIERVYVGSSEDDAYSAALAQDIAYLKTVAAGVKKAMLLPTAWATMNPNYQYTDAQIFPSATGIYDELPKYASDFVGMAMLDDPNFWDQVFAKTEEKIRLLYKAIHAYGYAYQMFKLLTKAKDEYKASYTAKLSSFVDFLNTAKADPNLAALVPDPSNIRAVIETTQKPAAVIPPVVLPPAPVVQVAPIMQPISATDMVVAVNAPIPKVVEAGGKSSMVPLIIGAATAAYLLFK